ncbi:hypothetical protein BH11MYX3_BH11MYX3_48650 [soil metagenome]
MADRAFTDLELERVLAEDVPASELDGKATTADRQRLDELRAEHQAFLSTVDVDAEVRAIGRKMEKLPAEPRKLATWWRWVISGGVLAATAAAVLIVVNRGNEHQTPDDDLGVKGDGISLIIHTESRRLATGDTVHPGERIRFEIKAARRGYVTVIGIDGAGSRTTYFPYGAEAAAPIDPSGSRILPGAIQLDATPGDEKFFAVYATRPFTTDEAIAAIASPRPGMSSAEVVLKKQP